MKIRLAFVWLVASLLAVSSPALLAQRGGGRRGASSTLKEYDGKDYGLHFPVPEDLSLYTPEEPGRFGSVLRESDRRIALMVDPANPAISISIKYAPDMTDADLKTLKATLDANPPQAKLPGYKKIAVDTPKVGAHDDKDSVSHTFVTKEASGMQTTRQVMFVHKGRGFTVICIAPEKEFERANKRTFEHLLATIEFR